MTATVDARQGTSSKFQLTSVRRRDVRRLHEFGPPPGVTLPTKHGDKGDPRYPSPHIFRGFLGITVDVLLHLACAVAVFVAFANKPANSLAVVLLAVPVTYIAVSILHRIVVQRVVQTTLGKALTGLRIIRDDTGGPATLWPLTKAWLLGTVAVIGGVLSH
jgi:hypothetical protein